MMHDLSDACMLKVEDVSMQFGGVLAVNSLDIEVPKDRIVALIGPNGAGKTTAFNCISGYMSPTCYLLRRQSDTAQLSAG